MGRYHLTFTALEQQGLPLLHASGDAFMRDLADGESILVRPTSLLYWDAETDLSLHLEYAYVPGKPTRRKLARYSTIWLRLRGPGRVAVQSAYEQTEDAGAPDYRSFPSWHRWPAPSTTTEPE
ncbi:MAG TPA: AIM24 family protein [Streptosporangiaceae bacterium]|nr:AIM24 family protein [Streptosporangiaceae bacterium]